MINERLVIEMLSLLIIMPLASAISDTDTLLPGLDNVSLGDQIPKEEWNRTFGGSSNDVGTYGQQTKDGGLYHYRLHHRLTVPTHLFPGS